jgi:methanogenic corrinoid protein MtbC1
MREVGERWRKGQIGVGEEHFATNLLRGRLIALGSGWGSGSGPLAVLACPPGEQHDLGLVAFALILHRRGWRIAYLGADTPLDTLAEVARRLERPPVVLAASDATRFQEAQGSLRQLARESGGLYLGGGGAEASVASAVGASLLDEDPMAAAIALSASA